MCTAEPRALNSLSSSISAGALACTHATLEVASALLCFYLLANHFEGMSRDLSFPSATSVSGNLICKHTNLALRTRSVERGHGGRCPRARGIRRAPKRPLPEAGGNKKLIISFVSVGQTPLTSERLARRRASGG